MRYFMHLAYRGAAYHGWQRQPGDITVQQRVEEALSTVLRHPVAVTGAGRTDAGVSASCMIAHFDTDVPTERVTSLPRSINSILGQDIVVYGIVPVHPDAHARFDAAARTYRYYFALRRSPYSDGLVWFAPPSVDFDAMNRAAAELLTTSDFTSFSKLHTDTKTNICRVTAASWMPVTPADAGRVPMGAEGYFEITADRFLRNMVRAIVGTLVEVGRGKLSLEGFREVIGRRDRCAAGTSMPGGPLFLHNIQYPYPLDFEIYGRSYD